MGCGPIQASFAIEESKKAVAAADAVAADTYAPYLYHRAQAYLYMAKTKAGFAEYEIAQEFARKAKTDAERATEGARKRFRLRNLMQQRQGGRQ